MKTRSRTEGLSATRMQLFLLISAMLVLAFPGNVAAQATSKEDEVVVVADEMPSYPGGAKALLDEIYKSITYPEDAVSNRIEGKVIVRFIITKEGKAVQPSISKGLYPSIDKEVLRVISRLQKFNPGKIGGNPVNVYYAVPITFKLS
jgi:protein TonB